MSALTSVPVSEGEAGIGTETNEYRARTLLALSLLNHRATPAGLTAVDVKVLRGALLGEWDV